MCHKQSEDPVFPQALEALWLVQETQAWELHGPELEFVPTPAKLCNLGNSSLASVKRESDYTSLRGLL